MPDSDISYEAIVELIRKEEIKANDRRKKRDWIAAMPSVLSYISGTMLIAVWGILIYISPPRGTDWAWLSFFGDYTPASFTWPKLPVNVAYFMLIACMVLCVAAFLFNRMRMKRKDDKYKVSVFLIGSVALITFVSFLVRFIPMGILGSL